MPCDQVSGIQGIKKGVDKKKGPSKEEEAQPAEQSSVISRHPEGKTAAKYEHDESGFLWSWNFMISKRWKNISNTGATGDIPFMDKLLADFRYKQAQCHPNHNYLYLMQGNP